MAVEGHVYLWRAMYSCGGLCIAMEGCGGPFMAGEGYV